MEKNELVVLSRLRTNARESLTNMSRKTSIPITTIYNKLRNFEGSLIKKYVALLDFTKIGYNTRAILVLRSKKEFKEKLAEFLTDSKAVNSLYKINNGFDFLVEVVFQGIGDVEYFVEDLENNFKVEKKEIYYIISEINKEVFLGKHEYIKMTGDKNELKEYIEKT